MARNVSKVARSLGARVIGKVPDTGGGAFGAARLAAALHARLQPSSGRRPGRPTDSQWIKHSKVPMSQQTYEALEQLAEQLSTSERRVSPMQVAAHLLEESVRSTTGQLNGPE